MCNSWLRLVLTATLTKLRQYFLPCTIYVWQLAETCPDSDFDQTSAVFLTLYNICVTVGWDLSWQRLRPDFSSISCLVQYMCDSWLRLVLTTTSARLQQYFLPCTTYVWQLAETLLDNDFDQTSAIFLTLYNICVIVRWDLSWQRLRPDFSSISYLVQHMCDSSMRLVLTSTSTRLQQYFLPCTIYVWQLAETCPDSDFDQTSAVFLTLYNICVIVGWDLSWRRLRPNFSSISYLVQHTRGIWKVLSTVQYLSNQLTNPFMFGIILNSCLYSVLRNKFEMEGV